MRNTSRNNLFLDDFSAQNVDQRTKQIRVLASQNQWPKRVCKSIAVRHQERRQSRRAVFKERRPQRRFVVCESEKLNAVHAKRRSERLQADVEIRRQQRSKTKRCVCFLTFTQRCMRNVVSLFEYRNQRSHFFRRRFQFCVVERILRSFD